MPMDTVGDRYFQPGIETMPRAELTKLQTERILSLVPHAYERSAFYREVWDAAGVRPSPARAHAGALTARAARLTPGSVLVP